jgi:hypothetical protein
MKRPIFVAAVLAVLLLGARTTPAAEPQIGDTPRLTLGRPFACTDYGGNMIYLVDAEGHAIWQYPAQRPMDVWILPNGNILFSHVKGVKEVTLLKSVVWEYKTAPENEIHACQPLPEGTVMIAESGPMRIIEVDRKGAITRDVKLTSKQTHPHRQMRCVRKLVGGDYLVGQILEDVLREYDPTGKIVREIPQKQAYGGIRLPNGNTLMGTGDAHSIVEIDPQGKTVWEINENDLPGNPLRFIAGMQRLPNGNTVVCNWGGHGHVGEQPQIFEVTRDKKVVGEIFDFTQFNTITGVYVMDVEGDPSAYEILR